MIQKGVFEGYPLNYFSLENSVKSNPTRVEELCIFWDVEIFNANAIAFAFLGKPRCQTPSPT